MDAKKKMRTVNPMANRAVNDRRKELTKELVENLISTAQSYIRLNQIKEQPQDLVDSIIDGSLAFLFQTIEMLLTSVIPFTKELTQEILINGMQEISNNYFQRIRNEYLEAKGEK